MARPEMAAEERWVEADDGFRLSVLDCPGRVGGRGIAVLGHAMMVDRRTMFRRAGPCLTRTLWEQGFRVLVPDLRGHGRSGPTAQQGGSWSYDRLVADVPTFLALARELEPERPIFLLGNSLFAHVALAYLGTHPRESVAGLVGFSMNVWNRRWTDRWWRLAVKLAIVGASVPIVRLAGKMPARLLRLGTMDEPAEYWRWMERTTPSNGWRSDDGVDYAAAMGRVPCPVLHVLSSGDRLLCQPDDALRFTAALGSLRTVIRLGADCEEPALRGLAPGHIEMVRSPSCEPLWRYVADWMAAKGGQLPGGQG